MTHVDTKTATATSTELELREPSMFRVIYLNDDTTSVDFVVDSLVRYFHYTADTAEKLTLDIHDSGSAVVAVLPYELAEQKGIEITIEARQSGYPLQIRLEPDQD